MATQAIYLIPLSAPVAESGIPAGWHRQPRPCARNSRRLACVSLTRGTHITNGKPANSFRLKTVVVTDTTRDEWRAGHPWINQSTVRAVR